MADTVCTEMTVWQTQLPGGEPNEHREVPWKKGVCAPVVGRVSALLSTPCPAPLTLLPLCDPIQGR